jgi:predicted short-subunit dehydrogenase-like oxidoreductase (DUF2520 family)
MNTKYLILGDGRLASHLLCYFSYLNLNYVQWSRKRNLAEDLAEIVKSCTHIIFLLKDDAIIDYVKLPIWGERMLIHCSGALVIEGCISAHPLMTFGLELYDLEDYKAIPFVIDMKSVEFSELLPGLPNSHFRLREEFKPLYHALCVCGGNFMTILWQLVFSESAKSLGLSHEVFFPFIDRVVKNLKANPETALTGPFVREDFSTIEKNLEALKGTQLEEVYQVFKDLYFLHTLVSETHHNFKTLN